MANLQNVIDETRRIRTENKIAPRDKLRLIVAEGHVQAASKVPAKATVIREAKSIKALASLSEINFSETLPDGASVLKGIAGQLEIGLVLEKAVDQAQERERLQKEIAKVEAEAARIARKLENADFVAKAPAAVVAENRSRLEELRDRLAKLGQNLAKLSEPA